MYATPEKKSVAGYASLHRKPSFYYCILLANQVTASEAFVIARQIRAAALRHIGTTPPLPDPNQPRPHCGSSHPPDLSSEILGHADKTTLPSCSPARSTTTRRLVLELVDQSKQRLAVIVHSLNENLHATELLPRRHIATRRAGRAPETVRTYLFHLTGTLCASADLFQHRFTRAFHYLANRNWSSPSWIKPETADPVTRTYDAAMPLSLHSQQSRYISPVRLTCVPPQTNRETITHGQLPRDLILLAKQRHGAPLLLAVLYHHFYLYWRVQTDSRRQLFDRAVVAH
jgi:hypothetical protein